MASIETRKTVLVVEDDPAMRSFLEKVLLEIGCRVLQAESVAMGTRLFQTQKPDLVILDLRLPDGSGLDVCKKIRSHASLFSIPVIMLTVRAELDDKLAGFDAGADQYLAKPIEPREFALWAKALMRRVQVDRADGDELRAGELILDLKARKVSFQGQALPRLTMREYDLLYMLIKKRPRVLSRKTILSTLWKLIGTDHLVDYHMSNLRRKLPATISEKIQTIHGKGFRFLD